MEIAQQMHNEQRSATDVDPVLISETYRVLNQARAEGRKAADDQLKVKLGDAAGPDPAVLKMQRNLFRFSGAKTFTQLLEMNSLLTKGGKTQSWEDFKKDALALNEKYNRNHLQAEYQTARQAGHHARNWEAYQKQKHIFPNLKYKTVGDARVRDEHAAINNTIAPIDGEFWRKYYPPNGWRCRCYVVQTAEPATIAPDDVPEVKPEFRFNVGEEQEVFPENPPEGTKQHTYFAIANKYGTKKLQQAFERSKFSAPTTPVYKAKNNAVVEVSPFADQHDLERNFTVAKTIADEIGTDVIIRAHIDPGVLPGVKSPEYEIKGLLADRKSIAGIKGIRGAINEAKRQMMHQSVNPEGYPYIIVLDLAKIGKLDLRAIRNEVSRKVNAERGKHIDSIIFTYNDSAVELSRQHIIAGDYGGLDKLK